MFVIQGVPRPADSFHRWPRCSHRFDRVNDLAALRAMRQHPEATSITRLRPYVGLKTDVVDGAVQRIVQAGLALEGGRARPYALTATGLARAIPDTPVASDPVPHPRPARAAPHGGWRKA